MRLLADHCRWVRLDEIVVFLDTRAGDYLALDPDSSAIWLRFLDGEDGEQIRSIAETAAARGWIEPSEDEGKAAPVARPPLRPNLPRAVNRLLKARYLIANRGFETSYEWARARASLTDRPSDVSLEVAARVFARAEHLLPSRLGLQDCLPRSLALFVFLRDCGFAVSHRIGVRRFPFGAHAWVTRGAEPVNAAVDSIAPFTPIATLPA